VKEPNAQARLAAYNLLLQIGYKVASLEHDLSSENNNDYPLNNENEEDQMEEDDDNEENEDDEKEDHEDDDENEDMSQDDDEIVHQEENADGLKEFYLIMLAGLAGKTPHMVSASLEALSRVTYEFKGTKLLRNQTFGTELFETVLVLFDAQSKEIIKSLLGFCKVSIVSLPLNSYRAKLPALLKGLGKWASLGRNRFRIQIKHLLERCIKKFGYDIVAKHLPLEHHKLIIKLKKQTQKQQKKKAQKNLEKNKEHEKGRHEEEGNEKRSKKKDKAGVLLPDQEEDAQILDFLDPNALRGVKRSKSAQEIEEEEEEEIDEDFPLNDSGKIVISEESGKDKKRKSHSSASSSSSNSFSGGKRKRSRDDSNENQKAPFKQNKASKNTQADLPHSGKQYSAKKAKGDMLRPGKLEPYAYIPLQPKFLNKRKKAQSVKQFAPFTKKGK
jgi:ribosomal RNA-processing protein 12